jgi:two-component system NtrC family sensor kinase
MTGDVICVDKSTYDSLQQQLQQLQQSLQFLQLVIDSIPQLIFWKDTNLVYLGCNSQFARAVGANCTSEIIGKTDEELPVTDELLDLYQKCDRAVLESGEPQLRVVETFQTSDGK